MKSDFVKKIILLKQMLDDMEQDIGLSSLSGVEKNVYLAAQASKSQMVWFKRNKFLSTVLHKKCHVQHFSEH